MGTAGAMTAKKGVNALERVAEITSLSSGDWLRSLPRGAYTTARTVGRTRVLLWRQHVQRLKNSSQSILSDSAARNVSEQRILQPLQSALHEMQKIDDASDAKITLLLTESGKQSTDTLEARAHVAPLPPRPEPPVSVFVKGSGRHNARAKDSEWVFARKPLEESKPPECEEVVLVGDDGDSLLEGLSSNFFTAENGTVRTASEGVLEGTIKTIVQDVCAENGIALNGNAPKLSEAASQWEGAFITSTSRLVLPIGCVIPAEGEQLHLPSSAPSVNKIEELVRARVDALSEEVVDRTGSLQ